MNARKKTYSGREMYFDIQNCQSSVSEYWSLEIYLDMLQEIKSRRPPFREKEFNYRMVLFTEETIRAYNIQTVFFNVHNVKILEKCKYIQYLLKAIHHTKN